MPPEEHAKLSASGAHIWLNCSKSYALQKDIPNVGSVFTEEGTRAHAYAEMLLREMFAKGEVEQVEPDNKEMDIACHMYADFISERVNEDWEDTPTVLIEKRVDFSRWVKGGFGTSDCIIAKNDTLIVCDLKYGKGVKVDATNNPQLRLYALGALNEFELWNFKKVEMSIIQPRLDHISSETINIEELLAFGEIAKKASEEAFSEKGDAHSGEWCRFCRANPICKERAKRPLETIQKILSLTR